LHVGFCVFGIRSGDRRTGVKVDVAGGVYDDVAVDDNGGVNIDVDVRRR
jgi:hypothetical protein